VPSVDSSHVWGFECCWLAEYIAIEMQNADLTGLFDAEFESKMEQLCPVA
jgi:hypothetical protein